MNDAQYILITKVMKEAKNVEWWEGQTTGEEEVRVFGTFAYAKEALITAVKTLTKKCAFFPYKRGKYLPYEEYWQDCKEFIEEDPQAVLFRKVLSAVLSNPGSEPEGIEELDYQDTDDGDWYFAFVGGKDLIHVYNDGRRLETNIHRMSDDTQTYYFDYTEENDDGMVINGISIRLLNTAKKKKTSAKKKTKHQSDQEKAPEYEVMTFGSYVQDKEGKEKTPLTWRVLEKRDGMALVITEKVIDHVQFSANGKNSWTNSDLRKWLNAEFADFAFSDEEKAMIQQVGRKEKVFLLDLLDYWKYFTKPEDARAEYTDYCRAQAEAHYHSSIREPYAFWWLCSPNRLGMWGEEKTAYVFHVRNNGELNEFERAEYQDGVRPAVWIKF